ncbi:DUF2845 domain-containing protein [Marinobacter hydrocarbonoclasticus]|nr:DUF2845 domain-containing protein [Marinobacter nauticus]
MNKGHVILLLILFSGGSQAIEKTLHSARCGTKLLRVGSTLTQLKSACGSPQAIERVGGGSKEYSYRLSRSGGLTLFRIKHNRITAIRLVK